MLGVVSFWDSNQTEPHLTAIRGTAFGFGLLAFNLLLVSGRLRLQLGALWPRVCCHCEASSRGEMGSRASTSHVYNIMTCLATADIHSLILLHWKPNGEPRCWNVHATKSGCTSSPQSWQIFTTSWLKLAEGWLHVGEFQRNQDIHKNASRQLPVPVEGSNVVKLWKLRLFALPPSYRV